MVNQVPIDTQWVIRPYQEDDEGALLELRRICFPKDIAGSRREHHLWLAQDPYGCCECVAVSGSEVIGYQARLLAPLQISGRQTFADIGVDLMVAPRYRGRGVAGALVTATRLEAKQRGAEVSIGFRNAKWGRTLRVNGDVLLGHFPAMFRSTSTLGQVSLATWSLRYPLVNADHSISDPKEHVLVDLESLRPKTADLRDLALFERGFEDIRIIRTVQWLDWCYLRRPASQMRFLIVRTHNEPIGYVLYSTQQFHRIFTIGKIEHVAFPLAVGLTTARSALASVLRGTAGIDLWWSRAFPDSEFGRLLGDVGFGYCPDVASRVVVTIPDERTKELVLDRSKWYLSPSDML
jgi:GNAT superfamily N-acetyltransferase